MYGIFLFPWEVTGKPDSRLENATNPLRFYWIYLGDIYVVNQRPVLKIKFKYLKAAFCATWYFITLNPTHK